jgi:uncharacterized protein YbjT (DUF2867 family)
MRVVVVGASGRTGALIVKELVAAGDTVVGTIRNPKHMVDLVKQGVEAAMLDLDTSPLADFDQIFKGADAIVFAAGSAEADPNSDIDSKGVRRTVLTATKVGVKRYIAVSSLGATTKISENYDRPGMKAYFKAKKSANKSVRESKLDWTIIEPGTLTEAKGTGKVALSEGKHIGDGKIARADVAAVVVAAFKEPKTIGRTLQIVGGSTAVGAAIAKAVAQPVQDVDPLPTTAAKKKAVKAKAPETKKAPAKKAAAKKATPKKAPAKKSAKAPAKKAKTPSKKAPAKKATKAAAKKTRRS